MAKKNSGIPTQKKTQQKPQAKTVVPPTEETTVETIVPEEEKKVNISQATTKNLVGQTRSALDANHRVDLLGLAHKIFKEDPDAQRKFSLEFLDAMDTILAAGVVSALADEATFGEGSFSVVLQHKLYPQLVVTAKEMGVTLPAPKNLPPAADGTVTIEKEQVKVSKEAKEELKKEKAIEEEKPELDPKKVADMDEDALRKALSYILITGPKTTKVKDTLLRTVDFMRNYRMALADKAENAAEAKLKYDDYTTGQWLDDAFSFVEPTFLMHGIGRGMVSTVSLEKSPISAFMIMRRSLTKEDGTVEWDDQSIADAVKSIVTFVANNIIKQETKNMNSLDPKAKDYKETKKKYEASIIHYEDCIKYLTEADDIVENLIDGVDKKDIVLSKIYERIRNSYYPGKGRAMYKNLDENIVQRAGIILNMFREPGTRNPLYIETNISDLVQYTAEELKEIEKAALEAKKAEKEAETKND